MAEKLLVRKSISKAGDICAFTCFNPETASLSELTAIAGSRWTIEQCFEEAKGEVGLDHYEVRSYNGWYKHIALSCWASTLLTALKINATEVEFQEAITPEPPGSMDGFKRGEVFSFFVQGGNPQIILECAFKIKLYFSTQDFSTSLDFLAPPSSIYC